MSLMRNTPNRVYAGKAKESEAGGGKLYLNNIEMYCFDTKTGYDGSTFYAQFYASQLFQSWDDMKNYLKSGHNTIYILPNPYGTGETFEGSLHGQAITNAFMLFYDSESDTIFLHGYVNDEPLGFDVPHNLDHMTEFYNDGFEV